MHVMTNKEKPTSLDEAFTQVTLDCPGCLYNCYVMEESIGWTGDNLKERFRNLLFLILELSTIYQMAKITSKRKKSGWGKDVGKV